MPTARSPYTHRFTFSGALLLLIGCTVAQEPTAPSPPADTQGQVILPGATLNMKEKYIDLKGKVCLREGLLELVATVPAGKEHESILSLKTVPSQVHAALLMLGLKPGHPGRWVYEKEKVTAVDPAGDRVKISLRWQQQGQWVERPINDFILNSKTRKHLDSDEFVFAGSHVHKPQEGDPVYLADQTGDVVALVSFDTELLALPKAASNANDEVFWIADTQALPELGTEVVLRLRPAKPSQSIKE